MVSGIVLEGGEALAKTSGTRKDVNNGNPVLHLVHRDGP